MCHFIVIYHMSFVWCSCTTRTGSVISATVAYDSSPQSVGSGSDRIFGVRLDSDRRSAVSSLDDIDTGYPSRFVTGFAALILLLLLLLLLLNCVLNWPVFLAYNRLRHRPLGKTLRPTNHLFVALSYGRVQHL